MTRDRAYYLAFFQDILCEIESEADAIAAMQAFEAAIIDMMMYHEDQIKNYKSLHAKFLQADVKVWLIRKSSGLLNWSTNM